MANYTENYNLKKPEQTDFYSVDDYNSNVDKIEAVLIKKSENMNPVFSGAFSQNRKENSLIGLFSHAEGNGTTASDNSAHAEGVSTSASNIAAHAEGNGTNAKGYFSHAEGYSTTASGEGTHSEGKNTKAIGEYSHAEGEGTTASGYRSHTEGNLTTASGSSSHAEGYGTSASGYASHAEGNTSVASGDYSHAEGLYTTALHCQHAQGHYNNYATATEGSFNGVGDGTALVIGNGTHDISSNAFRVNYNGQIYAKSSTINTGADYAEYFEWSDVNPDNQDRVGYFVTFADGGKIKIADAEDYILGIVSGEPAVVGNGDEDWRGRYVMDAFGRYVMEYLEAADPITGELKPYTFYKTNPDYDPAQPYEQRDSRPEWDAIGMMGVLSVYDDGTCQVNGYCKCGDGGIATTTDRGLDAYRVIGRVTDNIIKVVFR